MSNFLVYIFLTRKCRVTLYSSKITFKTFNPCAKPNVLARHPGAKKCILPVNTWCELPGKRWFFVFLPLFERLWNIRFECKSQRVMFLTKIKGYSVVTCLSQDKSFLMMFSVNAHNHDTIGCTPGSCRSSSVFPQSGSWFVKINWSHQLLKEGILGIFHKWSHLLLNQSKRKIPLMEHWCYQKDRKFILSQLFTAFQEHFIFI